MSESERELAHDPSQEAEHPAPSFIMSTDYVFQGRLGLSPKAAQGEMEWAMLKPKEWRKDDVDIQITHYGLISTHCAPDGERHCIVRSSPPTS